MFRGCATGGERRRQAVAHLLDAKADCNAIDSMHGASALHRAAGAGHGSVVLIDTRALSKFVSRLLSWLSAAQICC